MSVSAVTPGLSLARTSLQDRRIAEELASCQPSSGAWTTWAPTVTDTGAGSFTPTGTPVYKYRLNYPEVFFLIDLHGTIAGAVTQINLTLPAGVTIPLVNHYNAVILDWAGGFAVGRCVINDNSIIIAEYNTTAFPAGTCGMHTAIVRAELSA